MPDPAPKNIDFDTWSALAHSDPNAFEALRMRLIDDVIRRAPPQRQHRLRCLQWRIDQIRRTSHTPMAACLRLSNMMWETVVGRHGLLAALHWGVGGHEKAPLMDTTPSGETACILPFPPRRR